MGSGARPVLRIPLILLALADLALLGRLLWPWPEVANLPLNGATGIDPAVVLLSYCGLIFWLTGKRHDAEQKALGTAARLGLLAGLLLVAGVLSNSLTGLAEEETQTALWSYGMWAACGLLWGIASWRGARAAGSWTGVLCGFWSALLSGLAAATTVLVEAIYASPSPVSQDPWKQYEGLAIGSPSLQALVHTLSSTSFYLLVTPLAGVAVGLLFVFFARRRRS